MPAAHWTSTSTLLVNRRGPSLNVGIRSAGLIHLFMARFPSGLGMGQFSGPRTVFGVVTYRHGVISRCVALCTFSGVHAGQIVTVNERLTLDAIAWVAVTITETRECATLL